MSTFSSSLVAPTALPRAPPASSSSTSASGGSTTGTSEPEWSRLVKSSLHPRLLRLPLLTLLFLHSLIVTAHTATLLVHPSSSSTNLVSIVFAFFKPTLIVCTSIAFTLGILPTLVVRRRLLSRRNLENLLCTPSGSTPPSLTITPTHKIEGSSALAQVIYPLTFSSTWLSAIFHGALSSLFTLSVIFAFAAYSDDPLWWLPFHQVSSIRRSTGSFGRVISTTNVYWRPNEVFWCLIVQGFLTGCITSIASVIVSRLRVQGKFTWPVPPNRIPVFPSSLLDCLAPEVSVKGSLTSRISSIVPIKVLYAVGLYSLTATFIFFLYLPIRLPLFRFYLAILPPLPTLRRLCIPTLRSGQDLLSLTNLSTLFTTSAVVAAIQGATLSAATNLWEIYATHPMGLTSTNSSAKPIETLLGALETYSPANAGGGTTSPAERNFLFTHALFDLTTLSTDTSTQGSEKRRAFFKYFAVPSRSTGHLASQSAFSSSLSGAPTTNNGIVSAWERLSETLLVIIKEAVKELQGNPSTPAGPAAATPATKTPSASTPSATEGKGKQIQVKSGGVVGSTPSLPAVASASSSAVQPCSTTNEPQTVWQRLVGPAKQPPASSAPSESKSAPPAAAPSPNSISISSTLSHLITSVPLLDSLSSQLVNRINTLTVNPSNSDALESHLRILTPLSLLLITHSILRLLPLSLQEDEWGSVTLSERKNLGNEDWSKAFSTVLNCLPQQQQQDEKDVLDVTLRNELLNGLQRNRVAFGS
ncbi:unnamed protein product [Sympodiomycopsis kandeliae]